MRIVDVGCGCGDQSLHLLQLSRNHSSTAGQGSGVHSASRPADVKNLRSRHNSSNRTETSNSAPLLDSYIGITLEPAQAALARERVRHWDSHTHANSSLGTAEIFCADAADPSSWTGDLQHAMTSLASSATAEDVCTTTWLLALDTMYHFRPSRLPLLHYAQTTLHASFMAFDLILADGVSWYDRFLLWLVCWFTGAPIGNFVERREYERILVAAGYDRACIEIRDISRHVFVGLSAFLDRRVKEAGPFGFRVGKFRAARLVFDWWARSGVVRGVVVVARRGKL